jgi:hypothetical protein
MIASEPRKPWYRESYVWLLILFPASAVVGGFITLKLAIDSYDGLVVDDYYKKGLEINQTLQRDQAAQTHGLNGVLRLDAQNRRISLQLQARPGYALPPRLELTLLYSTRAGLDIKLPLQQASANQYQAVLPELASGRWNLHLEAADWRLSASFLWPGATQIALGNS